MEKELVPLRIYVHDVLRRSRTTFSVLQSAVCYIEAIRRKIPDIAEQEKSGNVHKGDPMIEDRIELEEEAIIAQTSSSSYCRTRNNFNGHHCSRQHTNGNPRSDHVDDSSSQKRWRPEEMQSALETIALAPPSAVTTPMPSKGVPGGTHTRIQIPARSLLFQTAHGQSCLVSLPAKSVAANAHSAKLSNGVSG